MSDCLFCGIVKKEIPARLVCEDECGVAFLDVNPRSEGHVMVIPKTHVETILELSDEEVGNLFRLVKRITKQLKEALSPDGFTFGINHGTNAGQVVRHLHIHVIPRYKGDGGKSIHSVVDNPPKVSLEETLTKILKA